MHQKSWSYAVLLCYICYAYAIYCYAYAIFVPDIWWVTDVIIFHFGLFFALLPPNSPKNQNLKKNEKYAWRYHHFIYLYQKLRSGVRFLRYGARQTDGLRDGRTNGQTERRKKWHLEVGASFKDNDVSLEWSILDKTKPSSPGSRNCMLCLIEKYHFLFSRFNVLNKRKELVSKCRHLNKYHLSNYKNVIP